MNVSMKSRKGTVRCLAVAVLAIAGVVAHPGMASADVNDCASQWHCWWSGGSYNGTRWQVSGNNVNLSAKGIATQSAYNHGTSGQQNCGYYGISYSNGTSTKTASSTTHTYSARGVASNQWKAPGLACS